MSHITVKQNKLGMNTDEMSKIQNIDFQHDVGTTPLMTHFQATINNASLDHDGQSNIYYGAFPLHGTVRFGTARYGTVRLSSGRFAFPPQFSTAIEWAGLFTRRYNCAASTAVTSS